MRKLLFILLMLGSTVQAQFSPMVGILAGQDGEPAYARPFSDIYISQSSLQQSPSGGIRNTGTDLSEDGFHLIDVSDVNDVVMHWDIGSPFDLDEFGAYTSIDVNAAAGGNASCQGIMYSDDDLTIYLADLGHDGILQWDLASAGVIAGATWIGEFNPSETLNELVINMNPDGKAFQIHPFNDLKVYQYNTATDYNVLSATYDGSVTLNVTAHNHYISYLDDTGTSFAYRDTGLGGTNDMLIKGTLDAGYDFLGGLNTDVDRSKNFSNQTDGMAGIKWHENDAVGSFVSGSYNDDRWNKFRFLGDDTYTTAVDESKYYFDGVYGHQILTPLELIPNGGDASWVMDVTISTDKGSTLNELAGSYANNYLRLWQVQSSNLLSIQVYDGTNNVTSAAGWTNDGLRHQHVVTYEMGVGIKWYVDGVIHETDNDTDLADWGNLTDVNQMMFVGARQNGSGALKGDYHNFQFYGKTLSQTEITDLNTDITDTATVLELYLGDEKGDYFWKDESGNDLHAGVEGVQHMPFAQAGISASPISPYDEESTISQFSTGNSGVVSLDDTTSQDGVFSLKTVGGATFYAYSSMTVEGLVANATYSVGIWAKSDTVTQQNIDFPISGGWTVDTLEYTTSTSWTYYEFDVTKDGTTQGIIYFKSCQATPDDGAIIWVDGLTLTEN